MFQIFKALKVLSRSKSHLFLALVSVLSHISKSLFTWKSRNGSNTYFDFAFIFIFLGQAYKSVLENEIFESKTHAAVKPGNNYRVLLWVP